MDRRVSTFDRISFFLIAALSHLAHANLPKIFDNNSGISARNNAANSLGDFLMATLLNIVAPIASVIMLVFGLWLVGMRRDYGRGFTCLVCGLALLCIKPILKMGKDVFGN